MSHTVIIGNGIAGITTARHLRKNSDTEQITVISAETKHFFSRTALMYIYMGHMRFKDTKPYEDWFWEKNRIDLVFKRVEKVEFDRKMLKFNDNGELSYDKLVLAVGSKWNRFGWPGQDLDGVGGMFSYQDLQYLEERTDRIETAVIVGGGLIGVELAEMLLTRGKKVIFLVREKEFWGNVLPKAEAQMIAEHMANDHHVDLRFESELKEILDDGNGKVKAVVTKDGEIIPCEFVGLTAGVSPNVDFLKNSDLEIDKGILVDNYLRTNKEDVYAAGDCAQMREPLSGRRAIEPIWYTGRMMGEALGKTLASRETKYQPGVWFNSAKFFDIEYQTYGYVPARLEDGMEEFVWKHPKEYLLLHFVFRAEDHRFLGINTFGIRMRHELFDQWLNEKKAVEYVLEHLRDANFDPEFYKTYEKDIVTQFNDNFRTDITIKEKSWKRILNAVKG